MSVSRFPRDKRQESPGEVVEWNPATLERRRVFPHTLRTLNGASATVDEPWMVLAGTAEDRKGKIELIDLNAGVAWRYRANTSHPAAVLLPEKRVALILRGRGVTQIRYLDQEPIWQEKVRAGKVSR